MRVIDFDPTDAAFLGDPHRVFDRLRSSGPIARDPLGWSTIDHATSEAAFHDTALVPGIDHLLAQRGIEHLWGVMEHTLTDAEGDAHRRLRRAVSPWFSARRIAELRARTQSLVRGLLAAHDPGAPLDVMAELADIVPARLFVWMVGAPDADAPELARLSKALLRVFTATEEMVEPVRAAKHTLAEYTHELLRSRSQSPSDDLTSALLDAERSGAIDAGDAFFLLEELLSASVDNTANTTALALLTLARQSGAWQRVHDDPSLVDRAAEECGRFEPAIRHTIKFAVADTSLANVAIAAGEVVTVRIAAAHRDPAVHPDPHLFSLDRVKPRGQLAFGAGRHYCLGAALGRMEVAEMVAAMTQRWSSAAVLDGFDADVALSGVVRSLPMQGIT
jgi:cytochrome P450